MRTQVSDSDPRRIVAVIRRRLPLVVLCLVVAVGASIAYTLKAQKKYTATAALLFNNAPLSQQIAGLQAVSNYSPQSLQDTNTQLLKLGDLASKTAQQVGLGLTAEDVSSSLTISPQGDTTVVNLSSTLPSPALAANVANTYANTFVDEQENGDRRYYQSALTTVERQIARLNPSQASGPQALALQNRAQSLATLTQLRTGSVKLAARATIPTAASSPSMRKNVAAAAGLGLLLGIGLALLLQRLDQRIREPEELESTYDLPLLGAVPRFPALRRDRRDSRNEKDDRVIADTFQFVRARLRYFNVDRDLRVLAVVSAQPGDGKTTVAHWLADASAKMGERTLLIEADLRRPTVAEELGVNDGPGLADVLLGARTLHEATQSVEPAAAAARLNGRHGLDVMVAGALPPNPAEMLESQTMFDLLGQARSEYDFVVIDTPPLGVVSDALPLLRGVDGVAVVAAMGSNRRDAAQRLSATLRSVDVSLLGVIANNVRTRDAARYGYGYDYSPEPNSSDGRSVPLRDHEPLQNVPGTNGVASPQGNGVSPEPPFYGAETSVTANRSRDRAQDKSSSADSVEETAKWWTSTGSGAAKVGTKSLYSLMSSRSKRKRG